MAIAPIGAVGIPGVSGVQSAGAAGGAGGAGKGDFASGLEAVLQVQEDAEHVGPQRATGGLQDGPEFMAAAAKANLAVELTVAVRNKAVEAYQEIMRMQVSC